MAGRKNFPDRQKQRKVSAIARQEKSNKLTTAQKLAKTTPGSQEHTRLLKGQK